MKRLFLLRHAKTEPHSASIEDHERHLIARGRDDAVRMGDYMRQRGYRPDLILCSSAQRTVETLALALTKLDAHPAVDYFDSLYLAESKILQVHIAQAPDSSSALMLLGHNPGLEQLAARLSRAPVKRKAQDKFDLMEEKFPTGALAVLDFAIDHWREIRDKDGVLADFIRPKDLR